MIILCIRTDKPEAEISIYKDKQPLAYHKWLADRQLAETIHQKIRWLLDEQNLATEEIQGMAVFKGPGSFTGLRIGITVANAFADSLRIPIIGETGKAWQVEAAERLEAGQNDNIVIPEYGALPHVTLPKK